MPRFGQNHSVTRGLRGRGSRRLWAVLVGLLAVAALVSTSARLEAQASQKDFEEVLDAGLHVDYTGVQRTTVVNRGRQNWFEAQVIQRQDGRRLVRVVRPPGRAGEVEADNGVYSWKYQPRRRVVVITPSAAAHHRGQQHRKAQVPMTPVGTDTVAGRSATIYSVPPTRPGGPALRVWVDNSTQVPLRTDWTAKDGRQISQAFTVIRFEDGAGAFPGMRPPWPVGVALQVRKWPAGNGNSQVQMPVALPAQLPPNLLFDGIWLRELAGRQVLWLHFHAGRRDASIFETVVPPNGQPPSEAGVENWDLGPLNLTMVSTLPPGPQIRLHAAMRLVHR